MIIIWLNEKWNIVKYLYITKLNSSSNSAILGVGKVAELLGKLI